MARLTLTPTGRWILVATLVLLTAGYLLGYPQLSVIGMGCLVACVLAAFFAAGRLDSTAVLELSAARVTRGATIQAAVTLPDQRVRSVRPPGLALDAGTGLAVVDAGVVNGTATAGRTTQFDIQALRRGRTTIGPPISERRDLFGIVARRRRLTGTVPVVVRPAVVPLPAARRALRAGVPAVRGRNPETGIAFESLREYAEGDDIRRVHWGASLRTGDDSLLIRQGADSAEPGLSLVFHTAADVYGAEEAAEDFEQADFETAVDTAASILLAYTNAGIPFVFATSGGLRHAGRGGPGEGARLLDLLAEIRPTGAGPLSRAVAAARTPGAAQLIIVTGTESRDWAPAAQAATRWCKRVVVLEVGGGQAGNRNAPVDAASYDGRMPTTVAIRSLTDLVAAWPL